MFARPSYSRLIDGESSAKATACCRYRIGSADWSLPLGWHLALFLFVGALWGALPGDRTTNLPGSLAALFLPATAVAADGPPGYVLEWGMPGSGPGEFDAPAGIATDSGCNVYVVDSNNDRVQKFDSSGNLLLQWGMNGSGPGEFRNPIGIDVGPGNDVFVVDSGNDRIQVFDQFGNYVDQFGGSGTVDGRFGAPSHVQCDGSTLWITDTGNSRVQRFLAVFPYNHITTFGTFGTMAGEFQRPYGITVNPGASRVFVTDLMNIAWTQVFDLAGVFQGTIGTAGTGNGQFSGPRGLDTDSDGKIYVVDAGATVDRVQKFSPWTGTSTYLTQWGTTGSAPDQFQVPEDIAVCECHVFVTDRDNGRVQRFDNICISGMKWEDTDQDGVKDVSEIGLPGWTIELRDASGTLVETRTTGALGEYSIMGIAAGIYDIREVPQSGWYQTAPLSVSYNTTFTPGLTATGFDFGNVQENCFEPQAHHCPGGVHDQYDPTNPEPSNPSPGFLAAVTGLCGPNPVLTSYDTPPSDSQCFAETHGCWPDTCLVVGAELTFALAAHEGDTADDQISFWQNGVMVWSADIASLPGAGGGWSPGQAGTFTLSLDALPADLLGTTNVIAALQDGDLDILVRNQTYVDFMDLTVFTCCAVPATICGQKFHDENCNGVWDGGEPPLAGWEIVLAGSGGPPVSQFTNAAGEYCFSDLAPGSYVVHENQQPGWTQTFPAGVSYNVSLLYGQNEGGLNFGNVEICPDTSSFAATFGNVDGFNFPPEPSNPGPDLLPILNNCSNGPLPFYDAIADEQCFGETMTGWPTTCTVVGAEVCMRIRASSDQSSDPDTDSFYFYENGAPVWGISMNNLDPDGLWEEGEDLTFCLDLANLPAGSGGATNILAALQDGDLDVYIQDDTGVDYMTIDVIYCCNCATPACCTPPPAGICAWYPGDNTAPVVDLVSAPANGALVGDAAYAPGQVGDGFYFDGIGDRVEVPNRAKLNPSGTFSIDAWVRGDDLDAVGIETFVEKLGSANRGYWLYMDDGYLGYKIVGSGATASAVSSAFVADGDWHLVALTVAPSDVRLYVDGILVSQDLTAANYGSFANNRRFHIGGVPTGEDFGGWIDEVEFFRRALTEAEVQSLYDAGTSGKCRDTVSTTDIVRCSPGLGQVTISAEICNYGSGTQTYSWSLSGLPVGTGCDVPGPNSFLPASSGTVTVSAGACAQIFPIWVSCPTGMTAGDRSCWEFRAWREGEEPGECDLVATGEILFVGDDDGWEIEALTPVVQVDHSDSLSTEGEIAFRVVNRSDPAGIFDFQVGASHAGSEEWPVIGLDDQDPGERVEGRLELEPGQSDIIRVRGRFLRCARRIIHHVVLSQDLPGVNREGGSEGSLLAGGSNFVPVASVGFTSAEVVSESSSTGEIPEIAGHLLALRAMPTPFALSTQLTFQLLRETEVRVEVFAASGRRVRLLRDGVFAAGEHTVRWEGRSDLGREVSSGAYFVKLWTPERTLTRKVLLAR